jgi:hypothetical protein
MMERSVNNDDDDDGVVPACAVVAFLCESKSESLPSFTISKGAF